LYTVQRHSVKRCVWTALVSQCAAEMRFQVPPKTFRLDSWINGLSSKPSGGRLRKTAKYLSSPTMVAEFAYYET